MNGLFSLIAVIAATLALTEQRLLNSDSIDAYAFWLRLYMVPVFLLLVALLLWIAATKNGDMQNAIKFGLCSD